MKYESHTSWRAYYESLIAVNKTNHFIINSYGFHRELIIKIFKNTVVCCISTCITYQVSYEGKRRNWRCVCTLFWWHENLSSVTVKCAEMHPSKAIFFRSETQKCTLWCELLNKKNFYLQNRLHIYKINLRDYLISYIIYKIKIITAQWIIKH